MFQLGIVSCGWSPEIDWWMKSLFKPQIIRSRSLFVCAVSIAECRNCFGPSETSSVSFMTGAEIIPHGDNDGHYLEDWNGVGTVTNTTKIN